MTVQAKNVNPEVVAAISAAVYEMTGGGSLRIYPRESWKKMGIYNINVEGTDFELDVDELVENAECRAVHFTQTSSAWLAFGRQQMLLTSTR